MKDLTIAELAYFAGIIDGEGSIYIGNFSSNKKTGAKYYQTNMEITNTSKDLIVWINKTFGGRMWEYTPKQTPKNSRKKVYRWILTGDPLTYICKMIKPYIIAKKEQLNIMLKMRETFDKPVSHKGKQGFTSLDKDLLNLRQSYFEQMRALHCRNYNQE